MDFATETLSAGWPCVWRSAFASTAKSYARIGRQRPPNFATTRLNGRGYAHLSSLRANSKTARVAYVCDVDAAILAKFAAVAGKNARLCAQGRKRFPPRRVHLKVDHDRHPTHWHTPMAVLGLKAGKHVYVEKPSSHNPRELPVAAQEKYWQVVEVGDQQRSSAWPPIQLIRRFMGLGLIGEAYLAKACTLNTRGSMGFGKVVPVPASLNWDLWQGPAPQRIQGQYSSLQLALAAPLWHRRNPEQRYSRGAAPSGIPTDRHRDRRRRYQFQDDWEFYDTISSPSSSTGNHLLGGRGSRQGMRLYGRERG